MTESKECPADDILIVDDTPANLGLLSEILTSAGYRVRPAPGGALALRAARAIPPDLILLDINMPEMDGFEVCRQLKQDPSLEAIPVLFISALTDTRDKVEALSAGGLDYITKPFQSEEVLARVATHLQNRRYQQALMEKSRSLETALAELKSTQDRLVQTEKMASLGVLTAGIAHEINNPVNFIRTSVIALSRDMEDVHRLLECCDTCRQSCTDEEMRKRMDTIRAEIDYDLLVEELPRLVDHITLGVDRTVDIINSLRTYARPEGGEKTAVHLEELVDQTLILLRNNYKDRITIEKQMGDLPYIPVQPGRLLQVLSNVITNAIDALSQEPRPAEPRILIRTGSETFEGRSHAVIRVIDNGPGMTEETRGRIFDPFFTTKEIGRGTGLGMSISYGIIRDHGGHIEVTKGEEGGTVVSLFLPFEREEGK